MNVVCKPSSLYAHTRNQCVVSERRLIAVVVWAVRLLLNATNVVIVVVKLSVDLLNPHRVQSGLLLIPQDKVTLEAYTASTVKLLGGLARVAFVVPFDMSDQFSGNESRVHILKKYVVFAANPVTTLV